MKWSENKRAIMAALMARSNMGFSLPPREKVNYLKKDQKNLSLDGVIYELCSDLMEDTKSESAFFDEGIGWWREFKTEKEQKKCEEYAAEMVAFYEEC